MTKKIDLKDQVTLTDKEVISFDGILEMNELVTGEELRKRVMNKYNLSDYSAGLSVFEAEQAGKIHKTNGGYCLPGSLITSEIVSNFEKTLDRERDKQRMEREKARRERELEREIKLVKTYLFENCVNSAIDYKKTTHTWIKEISEWSGVQISREGLTTCLDMLAINSREIVKGINVYGLKTKN